MPIVSAFGLLLALGIRTHAASAQSVGGFPSPPSPPPASAPAPASATGAVPVAAAAVPAPAPAPGEPAAPAPSPGPEPSPPPPAAPPLAPATVVAAPAPVEALPAPIPAPDPTVHHHDGFYLSMGLGAGYAWSDVSKAPVFGDLSARGAGVALELALGGTVADGLVIGGGLYTTSVSRLRWKRTVVNGSDATQRGDQGAVALLGVFIDYYPNPKDGLHVQGALGIGTLNYERDSSTGVPPETWAGGGGGAMLGVGYEAWVASQWSLGGVLRVIGVSTAMRGEDSDIDFDGRAISTALLFSATYH